MWKRLNFDCCFNNILDGRSHTAPVAEAIFTMVSNHALAPSSKLAIENWADDDVYLGEHYPLQVQQCYRAMDLLLEHEKSI